MSNPDRNKHPHNQKRHRIPIISPTDQPQNNTTSSPLTFTQKLHSLPTNPPTHRIQSWLATTQHFPSTATTPLNPPKFPCLSDSDNITSTQDMDFDKKRWHRELNESANHSLPDIFPPPPGYLDPITSTGSCMPTRSPSPLTKFQNERRMPTSHSERASCRASGQEGRKHRHHTSSEHYEVCRSARKDTVQKKKEKQRDDNKSDSMVDSRAPQDRVKILKWADEVEEKMKGKDWDERESKFPRK